MPRKEGGDTWWRSRVYCLPSGNHRDEGVGKVKLGYVGESLRMGGDSIKSVYRVHLEDRYG